MKIARTVIWVFLAVAVTAAGFIGVVTYRGIRLYRIVTDFKTQIRYAIDNGETIGQVPAEDALAVGYLESIFSDNQELLEKLKGVVQRGLTDTQALQLGEVAAMVITYHKPAEGSVQDVVAHVIGSFPLGKRKPGFHRDGYFRSLVEDDLWNFGNCALAILGRDMIIFAEEEVAQTHQAMLEGVFSGDIIPLASGIRRQPLFFTMVIPDPRKLVPPQLRTHVQALVIKGMLAPEQGRMETVLLTPSAKSANYVVSILSDMKIASEVALRTQWKGIVQENTWGTQIGMWWAYEMVQTSEKSVLQKEFNLIRVKSEFERPMVNVVMKVIERMGRDMAQMKGSLDEKMDPRLVDERLFSRKPAHYWSEEHRWGPDWPFAGPATNLTEQAAVPATITTNQVAAPEPPSEASTPPTTAPVTPGA